MDEIILAHFFFIWNKIILQILLVLLQLEQLQQLQQQLFTGLPFQENTGKLTLEEF